MVLSDLQTSLVLGGGNALGAYHLGVCRKLLENEKLPGWIVGASIGAVTGAILAGNSPETRLDRLAEFWEQATQPMSHKLWWDVPNNLRAKINTGYAIAALGFGRPGLFSHRLPGLLSMLPWMPPDNGIGDHRPMADTFARLIDFDRLNDGKTRFSCLALDVETGQEVWFDTEHDRIGPEHLLASTALMPLFPPIELGGRLLCDPGLGNNLPLDRIFRDIPEVDHLCIAVDLFALGHGPPHTLDETAVRAQDLVFASQSRRAIEALKTLVETRHGAGIPTGNITVAHLAYRAPGHQRTLKPLDFSHASLAERKQQGAADLEAMLERYVQLKAQGVFTWLRTDAD